MKNGSRGRSSANKISKRGWFEGQPTKYRPEFCQQVIDYLSEGRALRGFAGQLGVEYKTLHNWRQQFPDFDSACNIGQSKAYVVYENALLHKVKTGEGDIQAITFGLRNRNREEWGDKQTVQHEGDAALLKIEVNRDPKSLSVNELEELIENSRRAKEILISPSRSNDDSAE